jgi:hypothetical protein
MHDIGLKICKSINVWEERKLDSHICFYTPSAVLYHLADMHEEDWPLTDAAGKRGALIAFAGTVIGFLVPS